MDIVLPSRFASSAFIPFISLLGQDGDSPRVTLDFSQLRQITPGGLTALAANVVRWKREGRIVVFHGVEQCPILQYLQRMNLFSSCGLRVPERFERHAATGRFVPVRLVDHPVDQMGSDIALCLAPGGDDGEHPLAALYDLAYYVFTETGNNVRQHSGGTGYAAAQVTPVDGLVRIAIADNGKGILKTFQEAGLSWSHGMSDAAAIAKAMEPRVSSRGQPSNQGVGLTLVSELAIMTKSWLSIVSGRGGVAIQPNGHVASFMLPSDGLYKGTLVLLISRQRRIHDFAQLLHDAKVRAGLLQAGPPTVTFTP